LGLNYDMPELALTFYDLPIPFTILSLCSVLCYRWFMVGWFYRHFYCCSCLHSSIWGKL